MTTDAILAELRTLPGAPDGLRERVRALPEPQPRFTWTLPRIELRRVVLVAAPAAVALAVGAAALHGVLAGGPQTSAQRALRAEPHVKNAGAGAAGWVGVTTTSDVPSFSVHTAGEALTLKGVRLATQVRDATSLPPSATRLNKYSAWLRVRVDGDRLAKSTTRARVATRCTC